MLNLWLTIKMLDLSFLVQSLKDHIVVLKVCCTFRTYLNFWRSLKGRYILSFIDQPYHSGTAIVINSAYFKGSWYSTQTILVFYQLHHTDRYHYYFEHFPKSLISLNLVEFPWFYLSCPSSIFRILLLFTVSWLLAFRDDAKHWGHFGPLPCWPGFLYYLCLHVPFSRSKNFRTMMSLPMPNNSIPLSLYVLLVILWVSCAICCKAAFHGNISPYWHDTTSLLFRMTCVP